MNFQRLGFAVAAYHYLRYNNLLCHLRGNIIGRDDFLGRYAVCNLLGKLVVIYRAADALFGEFVAKARGKFVVVYVPVFRNGELLVVIGVCGGSNLVVERRLLFNPIVLFGRFGYLFVVYRVLLHLLFERRYHRREFDEDVFALCGHVLNLHTELLVLGGELIVNSAGLLAEERRLLRHLIGKRV